MQKILSLFIVVVTIFIFSCQQELPEIQLQIEQCKIIRGDYFGGGGMHDSAQFIYNAQGRLVKWINIDGHYDYYYSGNNISARVYTDNSGATWYIDTVRYNSDNTISEIVFYDLSGLYSQDTLHNKIIFHYQNNKVTSLDNVDYFDWGFGPQTDTTFTTITWNAAGNIEKMRLVNYGNFGWGYDDSVLYQYDANPNYFKLIHPHFFLFDPQFELQSGFEPHLAYFYSKNNVSNFNVYGTWDYPVVYGFDSTRKLTKVDMGGFPYMEYQYECH